MLCSDLAIPLQGYMMSYKHRMQAAACCFLLLAAAATVQTANAAGPDSFVGSLAGHVQVRDAWHAAAPISRYDT